MSDPSPHASLPNPIGPIEANVTIAGLEGVAVVWFAYYAITGAPLPLSFGGEWHWYYALYAVFALTGLLVVGLATEGLAGILELALTRKWWGKKRGTLWCWYERAVQLPPNWGPGQRWIWKSEQANREFSRRRLRLLVSRNTAACFVLATAFGVLGLVRHGATHSVVFALAIIAGVGASLLFGFLWLNAHRGWNRAVADAGEIGPP